METDQLLQIKGGTEYKQIEHYHEGIIMRGEFCGDGTVLYLELQKSTHDQTRKLNTYCTKTNFLVLLLYSSSIDATIGGNWAKGTLDHSAVTLLLPVHP